MIGQKLLKILIGDEWFAHHSRPHPRFENYGPKPLSKRGQKGTVMTMIIDRIALIIAIIGALNWGSVGLFQFDLVAWACGGVGTLLARIIYTVVALAGIWCISLLFRARESYDSLEDTK